MNNIEIYMLGFLSPIALLFIVMLVCLASEKLADLIADRKSNTSKWLYRYYCRVSQKANRVMTREQEEWRKQTLDDLDDFMKGNKL